MKKIILLYAITLLFFMRGDAQWSRINGPYGGTIKKLISDEFHTFALTGYDSLYRLSGQDTSWISIKTPVPLNTVQKLGSHLIIGAQNSIYLSNDNGVSWERKIGGGNTITNIVNNGAKLFAGSWNHFHVSLDSGNTWQTSPNLGGGFINFGFAGNRLFLSRMTPNGYEQSYSNNDGTTLIPTTSIPPFKSMVNNVSGAFAVTDYGVYFSSSSGMSWTARNNGLSDSSIMCLAIQDSSVYAGTPSGLFVSHNNGSTWGNMTFGLPRLIHSLTIKGMDIYAGTEDGVVVSRDKGLTWTSTNTNLHSVYANANAHSILVDSNKIYALTNKYLHVSENGNPWMVKKNGLPASGNICIAKLDNGLYVGNLWDGVFRSIDNGDSWTAINNGLVATAEYVYSIATHAGNIFIGTGNGVYTSSDKGASWTPAGTGIPAVPEIISLVGKDSFLFAGDKIKSLYVSVDKGKSWNKLPNIPVTFIWSALFMLIAILR